MTQARYKYIIGTFMHIDLDSLNEIWHNLALKDSFSKPVPLGGGGTADVPLWGL